MPEPIVPLAEGFPEATREDWLALVEEALKEGSLEDFLAGETVEGLRIRPLYARADADALPSVRTVPHPWEIRQRHGHPDPDTANGQIRRDLERGVDAVTLAIDPEGDKGIPVGSLDDLETVLCDIDPTRSPVHLDAGAGGLEAAELLAALWSGRGGAVGKIRGGFGLDPLAVGPEKAAAFAAGPAADFAGMRTIALSGQSAQAGRHGHVEELAVTLAAGTATLRAMEAAGLAPEKAVRHLSVRLAADADIFLTIAKIRAARLLWRRLLEACGAGERMPPLVAEPAPDLPDGEDPWRNLLRGAAACFAAAVAGADAICVTPHTAPDEMPDAFARRLARNVQLIFVEESHLGRVADPAHGSWAIDALTGRLAGSAWKRFQRIEAKGGLR